MDSNTLREAQAKKEAPRASPKRLPIVVTFVMRDHTEAVIAKEIREFCNERGLVFQSRLYDSWRYRYDRDEIQRLPAFHIEVNGAWDRTFYPDTRPFQHIQEVRHEYLVRLEARQMRRAAWRRWIQERITRVRRWFHRPTAMERYEAEEAVRRASMTTSAEEIEKRYSGVTLADWE